MVICAHSVGDFCYVDNYHKTSNVTFLFYLGGALPHFYARMVLYQDE